MLRGTILAAALVVGVNSASAMQDGIEAARASGQIGERSDGYVAVLDTGASADLRRRVQAVNIKRRALYTSLAQKRGVQPAEVGMVATCSFFPNLAEGSLYQWGDGVWRKVGRNGVGTLASYCE